MRNMGHRSVMAHMTHACALQAYISMHGIAHLGTCRSWHAYLVCRYYCSHTGCGTCDRVSITEYTDGVGALPGQMSYQHCSLRASMSQSNSQGNATLSTRPGILHIRGFGVLLLVLTPVLAVQEHLSHRAVALGMLYSGACSDEPSCPWASHAL